MEKEQKPKPTGLAMLREPFAANQISKLPKPYSKDSQKGNCKECGGYHGLPATHLDYVGHAALTDRLLDADPAWSWGFVAVDQSGNPVIDKDGGMWIKLTVCGITRLGYGDAQGKTGGNAMKERIGDALRNAAMRFGAALDLWHKGDLHGTDEDESPPAKAATVTQLKPEKPNASFDDEVKAIHACGSVHALTELWKTFDAQTQHALKPTFAEAKAKIVTADMQGQA
jgi:hypothetical protein